MTELAAALTYGDTTSEENKIYYRILKTTFYERNPDEVTGLHTEALGVLFPVELMDSCEKIKIQNWDAALYKKGVLLTFAGLICRKLVMSWNIIPT